MIITDFEIKKVITENELNEIKIWLKTELDESPSNRGFYHNWNKFEDAKRNDNIFIIKISTSIIGFLVWSSNQVCAIIDYFEIKQSHRNNGIGAYFFNEVCTFWKKNNYCVIRLFCSPIESEEFWKKIGFIKFPDIKYSMPELTYYKPLIYLNETATEIDNQNKLELWDVEPHLASSYKPKWTWNLN